VKAFAIFAKTHPDTVLFFHSDPYDSAAIFPMMDLVKRYNIQNRVVWSGMRAFKGFDYKQMNEVYNLMDCHLLSTSGEGFGCPTVEAMACGVPSIITDYTTSRELVDEDGQSGLLVKLAGTETEENPLVHGNEILNGTLTGSWMVERGVMDIKDCVRQMDRIYTDHKLRARLGKTGVQKVKKLYSWDVVISQWDKLLKGMMDK